MYKSQPELTIQNFKKFVFYFESQVGNFIFEVFQFRQQCGKCLTTHSQIGKKPYEVQKLNFSVKGSPWLALFVSDVAFLHSLPDSEGKSNIGKNKIKFQ